jgi:hypothetical protein
MAIYRKTSKGIREIETRECHLSPRLRTALILVDGRRGDSELRRMIFGEADETLRALLEQGFIEAVAAAAPSTATATVPGSLGAATVPGSLGAATVPGSFAAATVPGSLDPAAPRQTVPGELAPTTVPAELRTLTGKAFEQLRRDAVRAFADAVGPMSEALAIKMEKARTHDDLRPLLGMAMNIILNTRGSKVAGDFSARFLT